MGIHEGLVKRCNFTVYALNNATSWQPAYLSATIPLQSQSKETHGRTTQRPPHRHRQFA